MFASFRVVFLLRVAGPVYFYQVIYNEAGKHRIQDAERILPRPSHLTTEPLQQPSARAHSNPKPRKTDSDLELGGQPGYKDRSREKLRRFLGDKRTKRAMLGYLQGWVETRSGVALGVTGR